MVARGRARARLAAALAAAAVVAAAAAALGRPPEALAAPPTEYEVKAAYLFNFAKFVEWPEAAFESKDAPIVIGVLGEDPFGAALDAVVEGRTAGGRPLAVKRFSRAQDCKRAHVLFVAASQAEGLHMVLTALDGASVFTVGDAPRFAERGGVAGFVTEEARVRFKINRAAAERAKLKVGSQLLKLAVLVTDAGGG